MSSRAEAVVVGSSIGVVCGQATRQLGAASWRGSSQGALEVIVVSSFGACAVEQTRGRDGCVVLKR